MREVTRVLGRLGGAGPTAGTRRNIRAGLLDQLVIATANAANALLALALLDESAAGLMLLSLGLGYLVIGINRAFVGDVLLALASRYDGERRDRLVRNGLATALTIGVVAGSAFAIIWAVWPSGWKLDLRDLIWVAPFLPVLLMHDTGRYSFLADRRPDRALIIDLVWVGVQAMIVVGLIVADRVSAAGLLVAWGLGAAAGATIFLVRAKAKPHRGSPKQWLVETRHLSGWFTANAIVGQLHTQAIGFLVAGRLSPADLAGLRAAQTGILQPMQNFITAVQGLLVPTASRLAADAGSAPDDQRDAAAEAFRRQIRTVVLGFVGLAVLTVMIMWPVARFVLAHVPKYAFAAPLALPISIQAALYLLQVPFSAGLRGLHQGRTLFIQYLAFAVLSLTGLVVGASIDRLVGAVWGLLAGTILGLAIMIALYLRSVRRILDSDAQGAHGRV